MTLSPFIWVGTVTLCAVCGASAFREFTVTREPLWLVAGVVAYNLSNVGWIMLIDQAGLARASMIASAAQIVALTLIGFWRGEAVGISGWVAACLVCLALVVANSSQPTTATKSDPSDDSQNLETSTPPRGNAAQNSMGD